jgi:hypothetical protein
MPTVVLGIGDTTFTRECEESHNDSGSRSKAAGSPGLPVEIVDGFVTTSPSVSLLPEVAGK